MHVISSHGRVTDHLLALPKWIGNLRVLIWYYHCCILAESMADYNQRMVCHKCKQELLRSASPFLPSSPLLQVPSVGVQSVVSCSKIHSITVLRELPGLAEVGRDSGIRHTAEFLCRWNEDDRSGDEDDRSGNEDDRSGDEDGESDSDSEIEVIADGHTIVEPDEVVHPQPSNSQGNNQSTSSVQLTEAPIKRIFASNSCICFVFPT